MMADLEALFAAARTARKNAYAPYSGYAVGAAILCDDGHIYSGANVENAAYPQGQCAEASAIGAMVTAGGRTIVQILVVGDGLELCTPCGGCRQRIREFATPTTRVHVANEEKVLKSYLRDELLPDSFGPGHIPPRPR